MKVNYLLTLILSLSIFTIPVTGQNVKDFKLKSVTNNMQFRLRDTRGKYVALHFLLKTECPVCIRHTREYLKNKERLPNVIQVFIKPDTKKEIQEWSNSLKNKEFDEVTIYRDPGAKLAKQLNIPDGYEFHNQVVHYPALVLINPDGKEVFRYIGKNNRDRYSFEQMESKIQVLSK
ncbi:peroxiredoxin family protein [Bacteroidota bacterium]